MPVLTEEAKALVKRMRDTAEELMVTQLSVAEVSAQVLAPASLFDDLILDDIPWVVGFGIEQQISGPHRHLSISSLARDHRLPEMGPLLLLMSEFGFDEHDPVQFSVTLYEKRGLTAHALQEVKLLS